MKTAEKKEKIATIRLSSYKDRLEKLGEGATV